MEYGKLISSLLVSTLIPLSAALLAACSEEREPEENCIIEVGKSDVKINLTVNEKLPHHTNIMVSDSLTRAVSGKQLRYYVSVYRVYNGQLANEYAQYDSENPSFTVNLPLGKYKIFTWSQYVDASDSTAKGYFYTDDFKDMLLRNKYSYQACDPYKMGCTATGDLKVSYKTSELNLCLTPAMGQYIIEATDTANYSVGKINVKYVGKLPCSLDVVNNHIFDYWSGISYTNASPTADCVAFDNVLAVNEDKISVMVEVYDTDGKLRARRKRIEFPVVRGKTTTVNAKIYTLLEPMDGYMDEGDGDINDKYDNTFYIGIQ